MASNLSDERYGPLVDVPQLSGRLDDLTAYAVKVLAEDPSLSPADILRERDRIVAERRRGQAAERARRRAAVDLLTKDLAAVLRQA